MSGVTETSGKGAADCTAVVASESVTAAGDGVSVALVLDCGDDGNGSGEASEENNFGEHGDGGRMLLGIDRKTGEVDTMKDTWGGADVFSRRW